MSTCGLITYGGQLVAIAAPRRVLLMPTIAVLESDHPRRRFVATLALVWREMQYGPEPEPYDPSVAQFYARWILMRGPDVDVDHRACTTAATWLGSVSTM